jgi:hypothetical protein
MIEIEARVGITQRREDAFALYRNYRWMRA